MKIFKRVMAVAAVLIFAGAIVTFVFPEKLVRLTVDIKRKSAGLERKEVTAGDHQIVYLEGGSGRETIVLIHGFGADKDTWPDMVKNLSGYHFIIPDLPGFGESTKLDSAKYDINSQVERLDKFLAGLGLESFYIGGNSMGGNVSGIYAERFPGKVKALILLNNSGVIPPVKSIVFKSIDNGVNPMLVNSTKDFEILLSYLFAKKPFIPRPFIGVLADRAISNRKFNDKIFRDLMASPAMMEDHFAALNMPVLIIWGDKDQLLDVSSVSVLEKGIKNHTIRILKDCGHLPMMERPEETAGYINFFLQNTGQMNNKN